MAKSFIPNSDTEFSNWASAFLTSVKDTPESYGLTAANVTDLEAKVADWDTKYGDLFQKRDAAKAATVNKDESRIALEAQLRSFSRQIQADPNVSDALKADAGLPVHSTSRKPVPVPTSTPLAEIIASNVQQHIFKFTDSANHNALSRPRGVKDIQIWGFIGNTAPTPEQNFEMLDAPTRMKAKLQFDEEQAGQTAWYRFRYVNTRGEVGPWSMVYSATILK